MSQVIQPDNIFDSSRFEPVTSRTWGCTLPLRYQAVKNLSQIVEQRTYSNCIVSKLSVYCQSLFKGYILFMSVHFCPFSCTVPPDALCTFLRFHPQGKIILLIAVDMLLSLCTILAALLVRETARVWSASISNRAARSKTVPVFQPYSAKGLQ